MVDMVEGPGVSGPMSAVARRDTGHAQMQTAQRAVWLLSLHT